MRLWPSDGRTPYREPSPNTRAGAASPSVALIPGGCMGWGVRAPSRQEIPGPYGTLLGSAQRTRGWGRRHRSDHTRKGLCTACARPLPAPPPPMHRPLPSTAPPTARPGPAHCPPRLPLPAPPPTACPAPFRTPRPRPHRRPSPWDLASHCAESKAFPRWRLLLGSHFSFSFHRKREGVLGPGSRGGAADPSDTRAFLLQG